MVIIWKTSPSLILESVGLVPQGEAETKAAEAARTVAEVNFILNVLGLMLWCGWVE